MNRAILFPFERVTGKHSLPVFSYKKVNLTVVVAPLGGQLRSNIYGIVFIQRGRIKLGLAVHD